MKSLKNKVAIVTGGGSGIGKAISLLYAMEGASFIDFSQCNFLCKVNVQGDPLE